MARRRASGRAAWPGRPGGGRPASGGFSRVRRGRRPARCRRRASMAERASSRRPDSCLLAPWHLRTTGPGSAAPRARRTLRPARREGDAVAPVPIAIAMHHPSVNLMSRDRRWRVSGIEVLYCTSRPATHARAIPLVSAGLHGSASAVPAVSTRPRRPPEPGVAAVNRRDFSGNEGARRVGIAAASSTQSWPNADRRTWRFPGPLAGKWGDMSGQA